MNITIENTTNETVKRTKTGYLASICGLALVASALVATQPWAAAPKAIPSSAARVGAVMAPATRSPLMFYIVGNEEHRTRLQADLDSDAQLRMEPLAQYILIVDSPAAEEGLARTMVEQVLNNNDAQFVDLRDLPSSAASVTTETPKFWAYEEAAWALY